MGKIIAICKSEKKGTAKKQISQVNLIENFGLEGDAHGGNWHRQVSLLDLSKIDIFNEKGGSVDYGDFGENLVIEGIDLSKIEIGEKLRIGECELEITQIGKTCHTKCEIFYRVGECIMPKNGIFAKVIKGGKVALGDDIIKI
jgi:MOSC domain-containing protein YiiM